MQGTFLRLFATMKISQILSFARLSDVQPAFKRLCNKLFLSVLTTLLLVGCQSSTSKDAKPINQTGITLFDDIKFNVSDWSDSNELNAPVRVHKIAPQVYAIDYSYPNWEKLSEREKIEISEIYLFGLTEFTYCAAASMAHQAGYPVVAIEAGYPLADMVVPPNQGSDVVLRHYVGFLQRGEDISIFSKTKTTAPWSAESTHLWDYQTQPLNEDNTQDKPCRQKLKKQYQW